MAVGSFFVAAPTAQNSPELHSRFINSFIQSSLLRSLTYYNMKTQLKSQQIFMSQLPCLEPAVAFIPNWLKTKHYSIFIKALLHTCQFIHFVWTETKDFVIQDYHEKHVFICICTVWSVNDRAAETAISKCTK